MVRSVDWKGCTAGLAVSLLLVACNAEPDGGPAEEADELPDITAADEDAEPEPKPEAEPEPEDPEPDPDGPEAEPEPDPEPAEDPDGYDGFPIDQPVEDISVIDEAYVNEVLRVLDENHANLLLRMRELGIEESSQDAYASVLRELTVTATPDLQPLLFDRALEFESEGWFREDVAPAESEVESLQSIGLECISALVVMDAQPFYAAPLDGYWFVGLEPRRELLDEAGSLWRLSGFGPDTGEELNYCDL